MRFDEWFHGEYRRAGEGKFPAIHRLALESGVSWSTVRRALNGSQLRAVNASTLARFTGGKVSAETLAFAPTRRELRDREPPSSDPPPMTGGHDAAAE